jgi:translation initiation factor 2B subunit (eIF-2B alpha/beta/delta family)
MSALVRIFVRHRSAVFCRPGSDTADSTSDPLEAIVGDVCADSADPNDEARRILRATAPTADFTLVRSGSPISISDGSTDRTVYPFLFESTGDDDPMEHVADEGEWIVPTTLLERDTAPGLWESYRRVAPDVDTVRTDETHGATWLSLRALEVLRDTAGEVACSSTRDGFERIRTLARELRTARPSMVVIRARIDRTMNGTAPTAEAVRDRAVEVIDDALDADRRAAAASADAITGFKGSVVTLSRSGTVAETLRRAGRDVFIGESRPAREGISAAEELAAAGLNVTLLTDAALPGRLRERDVACVLFGADRILSSGDVVNKVGSYPLAVTATANEIPVYVVATKDKITGTDEMITETGAPTDVYDGEYSVGVSNPIFERVPADLIHGVVTEDGVLDTTAIAQQAGEQESIASWTRPAEGTDE